MRLCLEETEYRATLRQCVDCLHRSEGLYDTVEPGLALLKKVALAAGMDFSVGSNLFDLTQLVLLHAAMQSAHSTAQQERDAIAAADDDALDAAASRSDEILLDLFADRTAGGGLTTADRKEQQRILRRLQSFCTSYRDLVRHSQKDKEAKKQLQTIRRLFPHSALESSLSAVMVEVAKTLQLPFPMLNIIENEFITRKLKLNPPPQLPPSSTSVVELPALPVIFVPISSVVKPVAKPVVRPAVKPVGKVVGKAVGKKVASPVQVGGGVVGGQLKAARKQLSRRGVDPLHASIDEATTLQEEEEEEGEEAEKARGKRTARSSKAPVQEEDEEVEDEEEKGEEQEEVSQPRSQRGPKAVVRGKKAVTRAAPEEDEEDVVEEPRPSKRPRRSATVRNYEETVAVDDEEEREEEEEADDSSALNGAADEEDEDDEEVEEKKAVAPVKRPVGRPRSDGKPAGSVKRKASTTPQSPPAKKKKKKARVSAPSSPDEEPSSASSHRSGDRNRDRRPFTAAEERWLKKGVIRFANNGRKWLMILKTVNAPPPHPCIHLT